VYLNKKHFLSILLGLELAALGVFSWLSSHLVVGYTYMPLIFLIVAVCAGALGLVVLVIFAREAGREFMGIHGLIL